LLLFVLHSLKEGLPAACVMNYVDPSAVAFKVRNYCVEERGKLSHCKWFNSRACHWFQSWIYCMEILFFF